jgi:hypothetical protein
MPVKEPQEPIEGYAERKLFGNNDTIMVSVVFGISVME